MLSSLDEIRARLSIEEVVGGYVQLKKAGRNYKGLCPFHNEKTPSFVVSPEKQIAYCFGCHRGGDIFKFIQEVENIDFKEAAGMLAERSHVKLDFGQNQGGGFQKQGLAPGLPVQEDARDRLRKVMEEATQFFVTQLWNTPEGAKVLDYLRKRGLSDATILSFRLGFAPDSFDELHNLLFDKGFQKQELLSAGLVRAQDTLRERIYDYFRCRLMFPICDMKGHVAAFGGRALKDGDQPKYLNSPDTPLYKKSKVLYGFHTAKEAVKKENALIFVEGYMDFLAFSQSGILHVAASSGTALTREQLLLVKRFTSELIFSFDADAAGREATERAIDLAQGMDFSLKVLAIPSGKDPAEYVQSGGDLQALIRQAEPYIDFLFRKTFENEDSGTPLGLRRIQSKLFPVIKRIPNLVERDSAVKKLAHLFSYHTNAAYSPEPKHIYDEMERMRTSSFSLHQESAQGSISNGTGKTGTVFSRSGGEDVYEYFFGLLYQYSEHFTFIKELLKPEHFSESYQDLYKAYLEYYNSHAHFDREAFLAQISAENAESMKVSALKVEILNETLSEEEIQKEFIQVAHWIRKKSFTLTRKRMLSAMRQAHDEGSNQSEDIFRAFSQIIQERL